VYRTSLSFPGDLALRLEVLLTLLAALGLLLLPVRLAAPLRRGWRRLARLPRRRALLASALVALLGSAGSMLWLGWPVATVSDEMGYLLIADTFARGRLTNPTPKVPEAFEAFHVVVRPTYTAKYPPGPAVTLALGQLLGHPGAGLCLAAALLAAACCWFLQGWLPPPWPLLGATLVAVRLGVGSYWGQSYWGGTSAAVGGLLLYGALPRMLPRPGRTARLPWAAVATGLFLLANTRPLEGALAALPAAALAAVALARHGWRWWRPALALCLGLAGGVVAILAYNHAVTGDPLQHPYRLHTAAYGVDALSPYVAPPPPVRYSSPVLAEGFARDFPRASGWRDALATGGGHVARMVRFVCGVPLMALAVLALVHPAHLRHRRGWKLLALLCILLPAAFHSVTAWWSPHYSAATVGPLVLLAMMGMRELSARSARRRPGAPAIAAALLSLTAILTLWELPAFRPDADNSSLFVQRMQSELARRGGRALVVVDDSLRGRNEWVDNRADLESAPVLWIQDLGPEVTRRVAAAYARPEVWRLRRDPPTLRFELRPEPP
jgi:hypothetical protein